MAKIKVAVIFGGANSEYEVSLRSATSILTNLSPEKYDVYMVGITRHGDWLLYNGDISLIIEDKWNNKRYTKTAFISPDRSRKAIVALNDDLMATYFDIDIIFPVLHGKNGEDGTIQGLFELSGIPYVGCGVLASAVCMDKEATHTILDYAGIPTARFKAIRKWNMGDFDVLEAELQNKFDYPMFVKPANAGSSVGVSKATDKDSLKAAMDLAFEHDEKILVEQAIVGQEVEVAVMGNNEPIASVVGEIVPAVALYDYSSKYLDDSAKLYIPAHISDEVSSLIRETAIKAYKVLGCKGLTRVDFFARADGSIILNEPNTLPGFTSISMYPKLFIAGGMTYPEIVDKLIGFALEK